MENSWKTLGISLQQFGRHLAEYKMKWSVTLKTSMNVSETVASVLDCWFLCLIKEELLFMARILMPRESRRVFAWNA